MSEHRTPSVNHKVFLQGRIRCPSLEPKTNPFVDPEGYRAYVENRHKSIQETAQEQQK